MKRQIVSFLAVAFLTVACKAQVAQPKAVPTQPQNAPETWAGNRAWLESVCTTNIMNYSGAEGEDSKAENFCSCAYTITQMDHSDYPTFANDIWGAIGESYESIQWTCDPNMTMFSVEDLIDLMFE